MKHIMSVAAVLLLGGCNPQNPAPVEYNHNKYFGRDQDERTVSSVDSGEISAKPLSPKEKDDFDKPAGVLMEPKRQVTAEEPVDEVAPLPATVPDDTKIIYHEVQEGETLQKIAAHYEQRLHDIAELNDLFEPYRLEEFQVLKIKVSSEVLNRINRENAKELTRKNAPAPVELIEETRGAVSEFIKPLEGKIIARFGDQTASGKNNGINIAAIDGTDIRSIAGGTVVYSGNDARFGNLMIIKLTAGSEQDTFAAYAHMKDLLLTKDTPVKQGQVIGHVGTSGDVTSPQLYFAIRKGKTAVDPESYLGW